MNVPCCKNWPLEKLNRPRRIRIPNQRTEPQSTVEHSEPKFALRSEICNVPCRFRAVHTALHPKQGFTCHLLRCKSFYLRLHADSTRTRFRQVPALEENAAQATFFSPPDYGAPGRSRTGDTSFAGSCLSHLATGALLKSAVETVMPRLLRVNL